MIPEREKEESNRIGKTRDHFMKIGDIKEIFHARMGMIKNRNNKDLSEAEEIKKRWQEYTEELCKKVPMLQLTTMVTQLESGILECEVKWALGGSIQTKLVDVMEFELSYFSFLEDQSYFKS